MKKQGEEKLLETLEHIINGDKFASTKVVIHKINDLLLDLNLELKYLNVELLVRGIELNKREDIMDGIYELEYLRDLLNPELSIVENIAELKKLGRFVKEHNIQSIGRIKRVYEEE